MILKHLTVRIYIVDVQGCDFSLFYYNKCQNLGLNMMKLGFRKKCLICQWEIGYNLTFIGLVVGQKNLLL